jgi:predicted transposase YbfD/YdcC
LKLLTLKGGLVTIDAMGCQKTIAAQIRQQGGDYLLSVKGNQPTLEEIVEESVELGLEDGVEEYGESYAQSVEKRSGAEIRREVWVMPAPDDLEELEAWSGLGSLLLARRTVISDGEEKVGTSAASGRVIPGSCWTPFVNTGRSRTRFTGAWMLPSTRVTAGSGSGTLRRTWRDSGTSR